MISISQLDKNLNKDNINLSNEDLYKLQSLLAKLASCEYENYLQTKHKQNDCHEISNGDISQEQDFSIINKIAA